MTVRHGYREKRLVAAIKILAVELESLDYSARRERRKIK
jgi:hypothetical protein